MSIKTPSFWYPDHSGRGAWRLLFLRPLSALYSLAFKLHQAGVRTQKADIPVVCVGNLTAGGTGKTPSVIAILDILKQEGIAKNPFFLIRGYGGSEHGPLLVNPDKHSSWDVGDESLILAKHAPTVVSADRVAGAKLAHEHGADLVLMDDGMQNPGIHKDFQIVVVNGEMGFGNELMMPAGPLREPLEDGFKKAHLFVLIGEDKVGVLEKLPGDVPLIRANLVTDQDELPPRDKRYLAFAGLGYPYKFFHYLQDTLSLNIVQTQAFADHCPYSEADLQTLHNTAQKLDAELITTQKDFMRLPANDNIHVHTVPVRLLLDDTPALVAALKDRLK